MNINAKFRPIHRWPQAETRNRKPSRFRASWGNTLKLLQRELRQLRARNVVIQLDLRENQLRLDGYPYANARPSSPRVILSFETSDGAYSYPCDTWSSWEDNVRAIALTLENLRSIERYGVTKHREQYAGWKALPSAGGSDATMTTEAAAEFVVAAGRNGLATHVRVLAVLNSVEAFREHYRAAARELHPDAGGSVAAFQRLQEAKRILDAHHGTE